MEDVRGRCANNTAVAGVRSASGAAEHIAVVALNGAIQRCIGKSTDAAVEFAERGSVLELCASVAVG